MKLDTLRQLFVHDLQDLYSAEDQISKALPKMAAAANSASLKRAFETHLKQTEEHVSRLETIFKQLGEKSEGEKCKGVEGLIKEGDDLIKKKPEAAVLDAGLIAAAQKVEHYEMAGYGTARTYAAELGENKAAELLQKTLDEEGDTDKKLTKLAEQTVNLKAAAA